MVSKGSSWGTGYLSHHFDPRRHWLKDTGGILSLKQLRQIWWRLSWLILTHVLFATAPFSDSCTFSPSFTGIDPRHERNCSGLNWHEASATWKLTLTPVGCSWLWLKTHVPTEFHAKTAGIAGLKNPHLFKSYHGFQHISKCRKWKMLLEL